jgi:hypothetical protein
MDVFPVIFTEFIGQECQQCQQRQNKVTNGMA